MVWIQAWQTLNKEYSFNVILSPLHWHGPVISRAISQLIFAISSFPVCNSTISCLCGGYQRDNTTATRNPIFPPCFFFYFRACTSLSSFLVLAVFLGLHSKTFFNHLEVISCQWDKITIKAVGYLLNCYCLKPPFWPTFSLHGGKINHRTTRKNGKNNFFTVCFYVLFCFASFFFKCKTIDIWFMGKAWKCASQKSQECI